MKDKLTRINAGYYIYETIKSIYRIDFINRGWQLSIFWPRTFICMKDTIEECIKFIEKQQDGRF